MTSELNLDTALAEADCVVVVTDHSCYDWVAIRQQVNPICDWTEQRRPGRPLERGAPGRPGGLSDSEKIFGRRLRRLKQISADSILETLEIRV